MATQKKRLTAHKKRDFFNNAFYEQNVGVDAIDYEKLPLY